jgi:hypothetical protein
MGLRKSIHCDQDVLFRFGLKIPLLVRPRMTRNHLNFLLAMFEVYAQMGICFGVQPRRTVKVEILSVQVGARLCIKILVAAHSDALRGSRSVSYV